MALIVGLLTRKTDEADRCEQISGECVALLSLTGYILSDYLRDCIARKKHLQKPKEKETLHLEERTKERPSKRKNESNNES
jgi:hypothetical protein